MLAFAAIFAIPGDTIRTHHIPLTQHFLHGHEHLRTKEEKRKNPKEEDYSFLDVLRYRYRMEPTWTYELRPTEGNESTHSTSREDFNKNYSFRGVPRFEETNQEENQHATSSGKIIGRVSLTLLSAEIEFFGEGGTKKKFTVLVDTGSGDLVIPSVDCHPSDNCGAELAKLDHVDRIDESTNDPLDPIEENAEQCYISGCINIFIINSSYHNKEQRILKFGGLELNDVDVLHVTSITSKRSMNMFGREFDGILGISGPLSTYDRLNGRGNVVWPKRSSQHEGYNILEAMYVALDSDSPWTLTFQFDLYHGLITKNSDLTNNGTMSLGFDEEKDCTFCEKSWMEFPVLESKSGYRYQKKRKHPECNPHSPRVNAQCTSEANHGETYLCENKEPQCCLDLKEPEDILMCPGNKPYRCGNECSAHSAENDTCCKEGLYECNDHGGSKDNCADGHWQTEVAIQIGDKTYDMGAYTVDSGTSELVLGGDIAEVLANQMDTLNGESQEYDEDEMRAIYKEMPKIKVKVYDQTTHQLTSMTYEIEPAAYLFVARKECQQGTSNCSSRVDVDSTKKTLWSHYVMVGKAKNSQEKILGLPFFRGRTILFKHEKDDDSPYGMSKKSMWIGDGDKCCRE